VGGGPAGSSCAWGLRKAGLRIAILDRARFPRHKPCGGWITPQVLADLCIDPPEYAGGRVLQPITGFSTSVLGFRELRTDYGAVVSYGVRRCEFDSFLLARSGAAVFEGVDAGRIQRSGGWWVIADRFQARLLIGAAGHFCPVARMMGARPAQEPAVLAQETEFEIAPGDAGLCRIRGETPELYFCPDMKGYGWCFRKGDYLNVGFGRLQTRGMPQQVSAFLEFLYKAGRVVNPIPAKPRGHAYMLYGTLRAVKAFGRP
jgi:flavin-dependent dehydrogenase